MEQKIRTITQIKSSQESSQEVYLTMNEIKAEMSKSKRVMGATDAEIKAAVERLNPDVGSMESRG